MNVGRAKGKVLKVVHESKLWDPCVCLYVERLQVTGVCFVRGRLWNGS